MKFVDIEYCWRPGHEDQTSPLLNAEDGQTPFSDQTLLPGLAGSCDHGAASVGMLSATRNAIGMKGMPTGATPFTYPEYSLEGGFRRPTAILNAIGATEAGDVIMLEMQTRRIPSEEFELLPAEFERVVYYAVMMATDDDRIVVAAAGNGGQCLDCNIHDSYIEYRNRADSGAIIVGAGSNVDRKPLNFSTYGSRVNLQGWGEGVATLGFGFLFTGDNDPNRRYWDEFNGTSAATPMVAAAVLLAQQAAKLHFGTPFGPFEMRQLLRGTVTPQGINSGFPPNAPNIIGPLPNVQAAITRLNESDARVFSTTAGGNTLNLNLATWGPSRARGRTLTFNVTSNSIVSLSVQPPVNAQCEALEVPGECVGFCAAYECTVPEIRFAEPPAVYQLTCQASAANQTLTVSAGLDSGDQVDLFMGNNSVNANVGCSEDI